MKVKHINQCPYCGSHNVQDRITEVQCLDCNSLDVLEEQPMFYKEPEVKPLITPIQLWDNKQWDVVNQLKAENKHITKKLFKALNLITASKKKRDDSYEPF